MKVEGRDAPRSLCHGLNESAMEERRSLKKERDVPMRQLRHAVDKNGGAPRRSRYGSSRCFRKSSMGAGRRDSFVGVLTIISSTAVVVVIRRRAVVGTVYRIMARRYGDDDRRTVVTAVVSITATIPVPIAGTDWDIDVTAAISVAVSITMIVSRGCFHAEKCDTNNDSKGEKQGMVFHGVSPFQADGDVVLKVQTVVLSMIEWYQRSHLRHTPKNLEQKIGKFRTFRIDRIPVRTRSIRKETKWKPSPIKSRHAFSPARKSPLVVVHRNEDRLNYSHKNQRRAPAPA